LTSIDKLRGPEREDALQRALGITALEIDGQLRCPELSEDVLALRELAEASEASVRGGNETALGLKWSKVSNLMFCVKIRSEHCAAVTILIFLTVSKYQELMNRILT
jgi:hypothetical protein